MTSLKQLLAHTLAAGLVACDEPTRPTMIHQLPEPSRLMAVTSGAIDPGALRVSENVSGHISGQIIGPNPACNGALTEIGTFTGQPGGTFVACVTNMQQRGDGALVFDLVHTYTTENGDTFTTSDHVVAGPINPPVYRINNSADITGGTGLYKGAFGFIHDSGTLNFAAGVVSVDYHGRISTP
jgi:hypothetical protein